MNRPAEGLRELVGGTFTALAARNFRLYVAGRVFSMVGMWIQSPVIPWLVYDLTDSNAALGTVQFLGQVPMTLLVVAAGVVADRHSRRNLVFVTQAAMMAAAFAMGVAAAAGRLNLPIIYAFALANGVFRALDVPARQALLVDLVQPRDLSNAIALRSAVFNVARILGPAAGGYLLAAYGPQACFFTKTALFVPMLFVLPLLKGLAPAGRRPAESAGSTQFSQLWEGVRYVWHSRDMSRVLALWCLFSLFGTWYTVLLASFAKSIYGTEAGEYSLIISAQGAGAIAAALTMAATSKTRSPQRWSIAGLCLVIAALAALSVNSYYFLAMPCAALYGFGMVSFTVSSDTLIQHLTENRFRGRVMGLRTLVFGGTVAIGALPAGFIASIRGVGPKKTVAIGAALLAASVAALGPRILRIKMNGTEAAETVFSPREENNASA